jgi:hypothetical protein
MGDRQMGYVEILSGLEEGEEVVTEGVVNVSEGSILKVINPAIPAEGVPVAAVSVTEE